MKLFAYPASRHVEQFYQEKLRELEREENQIKHFIQEAKTSRSQEAWRNYLSEVRSGDAFLIPFTLTNWPFVIPSRVFKEAGNQYFAIGRYQPENSDVVVIAEFDPNLSAKEVREAFTSLLSSSVFKKENFRRNATFRRRELFDSTGELNDPALKELLRDQVFLQQH